MLGNLRLENFVQGIEQRNKDKIGKEDDRNFKEGICIEKDH